MKNITIKPYILRREIQPGNWNNAFEQLRSDSIGDRLGDNYSKDKLNLDQMYNFIFSYDGDNIVQVSGCQMCSKNVVRVFSRYYVFKEYRTDSSYLFDKTDNFSELKYSLETLSDYKLVIWSRDKSAGFFKKLKEHRSDLFYNWKVHNKPIELMYKNNYQSIFYTGDISYMDEVVYDNN
tara:strand:+ start:4591 stop:5127 length:537 start_codon:yes stop_codon:yes gene_type:complete